MSKYNIEDLHKYQLRAIDFIKDKKKCALYMEMGLGKTAPTLTAIKQLLDQGVISKVLVISNLRIANEVWHREIATWSHLKDLKYSICTGSAKKREKGLKEDVSIYIINCENTVWLSRIKGITKYFDMIVLDESSLFKSRTSGRFKALKKFEYDYMVQLSGTPSPNSLIDLWSQIYLLDGGTRLQKNMTLYKWHYFYGDYFGRKWTPRNPDKIFSQIADIAFSMKTKDYIELPDAIFMYTNITLPDADLKNYKRLETDFFLKLQEEAVITIFNAATLSSKLLQFCNGAIYDEDKNIIEIHDAKLDALEEIIETNPDENILVAYNFKSDLKRIKERFKYANTLDDGDDIIALWNDKKIKLLLCHPASAGKGLNLQHGGSIIVWFGLTWNLEDYLQFNKRLHRQGQEKPVRINHIVAKGCIDELVLKCLSDKEQIQDQLLNYLKR